MKRSYINLRHHDHVYIIKPSIRNYTKPSILPHISHQSFPQILSYLRLAQIISLYYSIKYNHKHQQIKRTIINYLILTNRKYSKWQQKQFLDIILKQQQIQKIQLKSIYYYQKNYNFCNKITNNQNAIIIIQNQGQNQNKQQNLESNSNYKSKMNRYKQSIVNDVNRTYFKRYNIQKRKLNHTPHSRNQNSLQNNTNNSINNSQNTNNNNNSNSNSNNNNKLCIQKQINKKTNTLYQTQQAYPYFITLSTQPPSLKSQTSQNNQGPKLSCSHSQSQYGSNYQQSNQSCSRIQYNTLQHMQNYLKNVLIRLSHKYPSMGYIQGFNYIAKNMYLTGFQQQEAVKYLSFFVEQRNLGRIIMTNMSGIRRLSYVLKVYIFNYVPKVYKHLVKSQVQPQIFCTSWFITLFSEDLSVEIVNKLWHLFSIEGWKIFIKFGIALLCAYQDEIISKQFDQIFTYMRRILQKFNQQAKRKGARHTRIWQKNSKRQQIVWKLMSSVQVNGNIVNQLCREMLNLQFDSEIQIWRIQEGQNLYLSRNQRNSQKSLTTSGMDKRQNSLSYLNNTPNINYGSQLCCDRMPNMDPNPIVINAYRPNNVFSLCRNIDTCVQ